MEALDVISEVFGSLANVVDRMAVSIGGIVGLDPRTCRQLCRFGIVGVFVFSAYVVVMGFCVSVLLLHPGVAAIPAFVASTSVSYFGNAYWSFEAGVTSRNLIRFMGVVL